MNSHSIGIFYFTLLVGRNAQGDDTGGLWNRATKQRIAVLDGHTDTVLQVAFNATGTLVATAGMDGVVKIWSCGGRSSGEVHAYHALSWAGE